ncbi:hypothetical protein [Streptomyces bluensis]|uniref:Acetyltransferase n=1 Tax=Streptomyces bluensis TaxID=33897 RepID=A0ABW6ULJ6_9ACTN
MSSSTVPGPSSNGLYQRIGYRPAQDFAARDFTAPATRTATTSLTATATP